ncbi:uncharacterized protein K02A2.6-like [Melitaea cinxia]|uniref:uncharacterized protein K02A2.6-like n=1 Tax=Melitaea cinxia TaxID=113334 RepID=UPI001E271AAC|nr:uncharacterized protein K02A2.6-like [Melitaea cinxia]
MEHARPPSELKIDGVGGPVSRADVWKKWKQQFLLFMKASGVYSESSSIQASLLVNLIGPDGFDIYQTFNFERDEDSDDVNIVLKKFDEYFGMKSNVTLMRYKFFSRNQELGESIQQYVTALRLLSKNCEFSTLEEDLIRDRIICGIRQNTVRDRLLRCEELNLEKAMRICQAEEIAQEGGQQMGSTSENTSHVDTVKMRRRDQEVACGWRSRTRSNNPASTSWRNTVGVPGSSAIITCRSCGNSRCGRKDECPARFIKCFTCGKQGHFSRFCNFNRNSTRNIGKFNRVHEIECNNNDRDSDSTDDNFQISVVEEGNKKGENWFQKLSCEHGVEKFKIDTGADYNIISYKRFKELGFNDEIIIKKTLALHSYTHNSIPLKGICIIPWTYKNVTYNLKFAIADMICNSILGYKSCEMLGLVKRIYSIEISNYDDVFKGLGCLPGKYHIVVNKSMAPVICASRKIPHSLRDRLKVELEKMEELNVIRKVTHPTQWVHPLVLVAKKNNGIRICLDPRELNKAVQRSHFQLPTVSELASRLHGARFFSVLDATAGFWTVALDDESADLCTFSTPFGRYQFLRLPFGINCASEVFHGKLKQFLEDLDGVENYIDDIIVWGETKEIHDNRLKALLDRARQINLKFNKDKCRFFVEEVKYLGHVFNVNGMRPDSEKIKAIKEMQVPKDRKDLERFLGAVNFLSKFIPNHSEIAVLLTNLLKKDNSWRWEDSERNAFDNLKKAVTSSSVLALYNPTQPIVMSVDASRNALGAVLLQNGRPVEFASCTLTDAQKRYAQIEKEMLAIVFACERFHQYIYGQSRVVVETDHKPLESIVKKPLMSIPARLQRMLLRIQGYDLVVRYVPGKYMYIADMLSRAALPDLYSSKIHDKVVCQVGMVVEGMPISNDKLTLVKRETKHDLELQILMKYIDLGWPNHNYNVSNEVKHYWSIKNELNVVDGVIFKGNLVLVPRKLRNEMLRIVHEGHLGIERCKRRARQVIYWPNISHDIEQYVKRCKTCQQYSNAPSKEPMIPVDIPNLPWMINKMKEIFARFGIPSVVITDNGTQYSSREFKMFSFEWGFDHVTSSPNYSQSNGKSERAVQTVKKMLKKSLASNEDFFLALLSYRNTPRDELSSPAELLMGRTLRCQLPVHPNILKPKLVNPLDYKTMLNKQHKTKLYYDQRCKELEELKGGDSVICIDGKVRYRGKVVGHANTPRSYIVQNSVGKRFRRNRRHLIKCKSDLNCNDGNDNSIEMYTDANDVCTTFLERYCNQT